MGDRRDSEQTFIYNTALSSLKKNVVCLNTIVGGPGRAKWIGHTFVWTLSRVFSVVGEYAKQEFAHTDIIGKDIGETARRGAVDDTCVATLKYPAAWAWCKSARLRLLSNR